MTHYLIYKNITLSSNDISSLVKDYVGNEGLNEHVYKFFFDPLLNNYREYYNNPDQKGSLESWVDSLYNVLQGYNSNKEWFSENYSKELYYEINSVIKGYVKFSLNVNDLDMRMSHLSYIRS